MLGKKSSPLEVLLAEFMPPEHAAAIEAAVANIQELPPVQQLGDLRTPVYGSDPNELLKHRFLYKGAICLLCGPTGIGKSSLLMQAAIHWSVGQPIFDIMPGEMYQRHGMRILLVQAENDEGDLAEMRDGVLKGCDHLSNAEKALAMQKIKVATVCDKSSDAFAATLDVLLLEKGPFDMVMIDPAFAYLGGDSNSQKDVSRFMRELLNPLIQKYEVGMVLAHHTNKPMRGKEKENWEAGDYAYLGAGSAEWINPARCALAIRSMGSDSVFEFRASKRGKRLRWENDKGEHTSTRYIAHHGEPGVICWRDATPEEVEALAEEDKGGRPKQYSDAECVHAVMSRPGESQNVYADLLAAKLGSSRRTGQEMLKAGVKNGWLRENGDRKMMRYEVTSEGRNEAQNRPSTFDWV